MADTVQEKMEELIKIQEEVKRAKDEAMQSWLDSRPLIDELEKLQSELASAKNRTSMSNIVILELESQLEAINSDIRTKTEEELKATSATNEMTHDLDQTRQELESIKHQTDKERRERSRLKQVLRMRRQNLRTLQLTLRAVRIESEAFGSSAEEAKRHINNSEKEKKHVVQLSQKEYHALRGRAKDETALAKWRVSVSVEQKLAAEASRNLASSRLKQIHSENRRKRGREEEEEKIMEDGNAIEKKEEEHDSRMRAGADHQVINKGKAFPKARADAIAKSSLQKPKRQKKRRSRRNKRDNSLVKRKKSSIFSQIKSFFVRSFSRLFG